MAALEYGLEAGLPFVIAELIGSAGHNAKHLIVNRAKQYPVGEHGWGRKPLARRFVDTPRKPIPWPRRTL
jgi:hypothetical protein